MIAIAGVAMWRFEAGSGVEAARKAVDNERERRIEGQDQLSSLTNSNQGVLQAMQPSSDRASNRITAVLEEAKDGQDDLRSGGRGDEAALSN